MNESSPQLRYPIDRWMNDLRYLLATAARLPFSERFAVLQTYYAASYPDCPHSSENRARLLACADYFLRHLQEFVVEHLADQHGDSCRISPHLEGALYRLFAGVQVDQLRCDFPITVLLDIADEQQKFDPDTDEE